APTEAAFRAGPEIRDRARQTDRTRREHLVESELMDGLAGAAVEHSAIAVADAPPRRAPDQHEPAPHGEHQRIPDPATGNEARRAAVADPHCSDPRAPGEV